MPTTHDRRETLTSSDCITGGQGSQKCSISSPGNSTVAKDVKGGQSSEHLWAQLGNHPNRFNTFLFFKFTQSLRTYCISRATKFRVVLRVYKGHFIDKLIGICACFLNTH
jgi:hypothetical protein